MAVRFRKYKAQKGEEINAIVLNEKNVAEVVAYINKNRGTALDETQVFTGDHLEGGSYTAVKVALVQKNVDKLGKLKKGVRKAFRGDVIVRKAVELANGKPGYEFSRIKAVDFESYTLV